MGLFRTAARASVAAHVVGNVHRRQNQRWASEDAAVAKQAQAQAPGATPLGAQIPAQASGATPLGAQTPAQAPGTTPLGAQTPAIASEPAASPDQGVDARLEQLTKLGQLRDSGVLTPAEFEAQKQQILAAN